MGRSIPARHPPLEDLVEEHAVAPLAQQEELVLCQPQKLRRQFVRYRVVTGKQRHQRQMVSAAGRLTLRRKTFSSPSLRSKS